MSGEFSDSRGGVHIHRSEEIIIRNCTFVGFSEELARLEATQSSRKLCPSRTTQVPGITLASYTPTHATSGLVLESAAFSGFKNVGLCRESILSIDPTIGWGPFNFFTSLQEISIESNEGNQLNLCAAYRNYIRDVYLVDRHGDLFPAASDSPKGGPFESGVVLTGGSKALSFLERDPCRLHRSGCYHYCENICLRTVVVSVDPSRIMDLELKICRRGTSICARYAGHVFYEGLDGQIGHFVQKRVYMYVSLPPGRYEGHFVDSTSDKRQWPTFVETYYSPAMCPNALVEGSIWIPPPPMERNCSSLLSNSEADDISGWISGPSGMRVFPGLGWNMSNAFCDMDPSRSKLYSFGQYLDTRCLVEGRKLLFQAMSRFHRNVYTDDESLSVNNETENCWSDIISGCHPTLGVLFVSNDGKFSWIKELDHEHNIFRTGRSSVVTDAVAAVASNDDEADGTFSSLEQYQPTDGTLTIDAEMASASSAFFFIHRLQEDRFAGWSFCVDNLSATIVL